MSSSAEFLRPLGKSAYSQRLSRQRSEEVSEKVNKGRSREDRYQRPLDTASGDDVKWRNTRHMWASFARRHSCLLLELMLRWNHGILCSSACGRLGRKSHLAHVSADERGLPSHICFTCQSHFLGRSHLLYDVFTMIGSAGPSCSRTVD